MIGFAFLVSLLFIGVFLFAFWPLWQEGARRARYGRIWLVLLFGVAAPALALYTVIGALPMVWLAP